MYKPEYSSRFKRDWKICLNKHWDEKALKEAMKEVLFSDEKVIHQKYNHHILQGNLSGVHEIHIGGRKSN